MTSAATLRAGSDRVLCLPNFPMSREFLRTGVPYVYRYRCVLCGRFVRFFPHGFMVRDAVWVEAGLHARENAHPRCFEAILGRPLRLSDLTDAIINTDIREAIRSGRPLPHPEPFDQTFEWELGGEG